MPVVAGVCAEGELELAPEIADDEADVRDARLEVDDEIGGSICTPESVKLSGSVPEGVLPRVDLSQHVVCWPGKVFCELP